MLHETFHLKDLYPALADISNDPTLTAYIPFNLSEMGWDNKTHPAVIICPGGGYEFTSKREDEPVALQLLSWGYQVFILNYSCHPHHFPAQLCEIAAALELIYANTDTWHTDVDKISIMGFSAGGHLAGHYSNSYDCPEVRALFPNSKGVAASILCYPVITAEPGIRHDGSIMNVSGHKQITDADIDKFSLERLVTSKTPPAFIWHTADDAVVPVENCLMYAKALAKHQIPFALHIYPHGGHGLSTVNDLTCGPLDEKVQHTGQWLPTLKEWLKVTL